MGSTQIECVAEEGAEENIWISGKKATEGWRQ